MNDDALVIKDLSVRYGASANVVQNVDLRIPRGSVVSLLGPNGAGKSTLMRAVGGLLAIHRGEVTNGSISLLGKDITRASATQRVKAGIAQSLEGRQVFADLSVADNLSSGGFVRRYGRNRESEVRDQVLAYFPKLGDLMDQKAGYLSGGEQQMLAIGRALMSGPELLLLDEPSLGLAPRIVEVVRDVIVEINRAGTSVLLVEQNAAMALSIADYGYVLEGGRIRSEGPADVLRSDPDFAALYLGGSTGQPAAIAAEELIERSAEHHA